MRRLALPLLIAALCLGLPRPAAGQVADTTLYGDRVLDADLLLHPGQPCAADEVLLYVQGFEATVCDSFLGVSRVPGRPITIRTLHRAQLACPAVIRPYAVPVPLGLLMAGTHSFVVRRERLVLSQDGTLDSTATESRYEFPVSAACPVITPVPVADLPLVETAATRPLRPCPDQPAALELAGHFTDGCGRVQSLTAIAPDHVSLVLAPYPPAPRPCTDNLPPWSASVPLGSFAAGTHSVAVDLTLRGALWQWPPIPDTHHRGLFTFNVTTPCDSLVTLLPYVESIQIGPRDPTRPICPSDSIQVTISGSFPDMCCATKRIVLLPNPAMTPLPQPPIVRVIVDHDTAVACPCGPVPERWTGIALLPPLPSHDYWLPVEVLERGGGPDSTLTATAVPFQVDTCGVGEACLWSGWEHQGSYGSCDAYVSTEREATVTLMVKPQVALAGLQGRLRSWEPGLRITGIEPVGVAAGMRLSWTRESQGARFVLFAEQGAPIPAGDVNSILAVRAVVEGMAWIPEGQPAPPGPVFHLGLDEVLGADAAGNGVLECPPPPYARLAPEVAVLCIEQPCDFNQDGLNDVRDIVQMVRCVNDDGPCPPDVGTRFDCNPDGRFGLDDVLCCAFHMLRQPGCPTCPIDTVRVEPTVTVAFGEPRRRSGAVDVPLVLSGLDRVGAARLRLRFPSDRFTAQLTGYAEIFYLQHVENDMLTLGMIGGMPVPVPAGGDPPPFDYPGPGLVVRLTLRPGQSFGGDLRLADGQLSGPDGVLLDVDLDVPGVPLEGNGVALSAPWPNPSTGPVQFTVTLDAPARLEVAVHDIAGRRLATVFRGNREAGLQDFWWNGRRDDGTETTTGVYFLRVVANDQVWKRKLVVVRGPETRQVLPTR